MCYGRVIIAQIFYSCHGRSEVLTAVMMIEVFWDVMPFFAAVSSELLTEWHSCAVQQTGNTWRGATWWCAVL